MPKKMFLEPSSSEMYAKLAAESAEQAKQIKVKLTKECNSLLQEIKETLLHKESFDSVIGNKDNKTLEDFRMALMDMRYYLK